MQSTVATQARQKHPVGTLLLGTHSDAESPRCSTLSQLKVTSAIFDCLVKRPPITDNAELSGPRCSMSSLSYSSRTTESQLDTACPWSTLAHLGMGSTCQSTRCGPLLISSVRTTQRDPRIWAGSTRRHFPDDICSLRITWRIVKQRSAAQLYGLTSAGTALIKRSKDRPLLWRLPSIVLAVVATCLVPVLYIAVPTE